MILHGNIVDIRSRTIQYGRLEVADGVISNITIEGDAKDSADYILPGFVDAHVHIESSMMMPSAFAELAVRHGTVATVSDPHEIANVLGIAGVKLMIDDIANSPFNIMFGAPSCVPATRFETAGAILDTEDVAELLDLPEIGYLSEVMNFPGVLNADPVVMAKIAAAVERGLPVDGHAPGLTGSAAQAYAAAGISTDHECYTYEEAKWKLECGMKIIIREGSAAKNFTALWKLIDEYPGRIMFCSDDKHPDDLMHGHINTLVIRARELGCDLFNVLEAACIVPVDHYGLKTGTVQAQDAANFIVVHDLVDFGIQQTWLNGQLCYDGNDVSLPARPSAKLMNAFQANEISSDELGLQLDQEEIQVIRAFDGELITKAESAAVVDPSGYHLERDVLKIVVVNRYVNARPAIAFVHGFGLQQGAIASSVAHDSHNIVAVGTNDADLSTAINQVVRAKGGVSCASGEHRDVVELPIGGIMSPDSGEQIAESYSRIDKYAREVLGSSLNAPFMTLSFMSLLVIPQLKLSDQGLFDVDRFEFTTL